MSQRLILLAAALAACLVSLPGNALARRPHVVLLVLDEFPVDSIRTPTGQIDARRFPGFAALARGSTWYPNATTIYDSTHHAVPEILDGRAPRRGRPTTDRGHPGNVFDVLGGRGWRIRALEPKTRLCSPRWCPHRHRPPVAGDFPTNRARVLGRELSTIKPARRPTFYFRHILLPHFPWHYLPSGQSYPGPAGEHKRLFTSFRGLYDPFLTLQARQRHLLQLQLVDRNVLRLIRRLRRDGMWRRTLLAVTADHGIAFDTGVSNRRIATRRTIDEIAPVPLFVKAPGQKHGRVDPALVRTPDVVPTMAALLHIRLGWRGRAGRAAGSRAVRRRTGITLVKRDFSGTLSLTLAELSARRQANLARFGHDFAHGLYGIGPHPDLIGQRLGDLSVAVAGGAHASFASPGVRFSGRTRHGVVPSRVTGTISGAPPKSVRDIALALNGRVAAVGRSVRLIGDGHERFSLLFPPSRLRRGRNSLELFAVSGSGSGSDLVLEPLP